MAAYQIRAFTAADQALVAGWRELPHVRAWWGDPALEPELDNLADPHIDQWIVALDGRPFAFVHDYAVHAWPDHHFAHLPAGARGLDLFIGEPDMLGRGHGPRFLRQHVDGLFARGVPACGIDPNPDNLPARRAFEAAGFTATHGPVQTRWGRAILMERHA